MSGGLVLGLIASSAGTYNLNGGLLALSAGGLTQGSGTATFNFGGGTLGALAPWSSSVNMNLSGIGGPGTVDTTGGNIGLSGNLTGSGGLNKVGPGTLTLSASNSYTGATTVSGGTLTFSGSGNSSLPGTVTVGASSGNAGTLLFAGTSAANLSNTTDNALDVNWGWRC